MTQPPYNKTIALDSRILNLVDDLTCQPNTELRSYWGSIIKGPEGPLFKNLEFQKLEKLHPYIFSYEVIENGVDFKIDYFGQYATEFAGGNFSGHFLSQNLNIVTEWRFGLYQMIVRKKRPFYYHSKGGVDESLIIFETAAFPLFDERGNVTYLLCSFDQFQNP